MAGFRLQRVIEGWELWRGETGMAWLRLACWLSSLISVGSSASGWVLRMWQGGRLRIVRCDALQAVESGLQPSQLPVTRNTHLFVTADRCQRG